MLQVSAESFKKIAKLAIANNKMLIEQRKILEDIQQTLAQSGGSNGGNKSDRKVTGETQNFVKETFPLKTEEELQTFEDGIADNTDENFKVSLVSSRE